MKLKKILLNGRSKELFIYNYYIRGKSSDLRLYSLEMPFLN